MQLEPNPHHQRAMLVTMTERGERAYRAATERQGRWAEALAADLSPEAIEAAAALLREMQRRLAGPGTTAIATTRIEEP